MPQKVRERLPVLSTVLIQVRTIIIPLWHMTCILRAFELSPTSHFSTIFYSQNLVSPKW